MKIGVIADTHLKAPTPFLEKVVECYFKDCDMILHAGDLVSPDVLEAFKDKKLVVVAGNRDSQEIKKRFPSTTTIQVKGYKIGVTHGSGSPFGIVNRLKKSFSSVDCIVFGHTHMPVNRMEEGCLIFNPGSFKYGIPHFWRKSIGILEIGTKLKGHVLRLPRER